MSDEDAFQSHLDAHPGDHTARLVFADWLQDRDDPRAEGYRAMGARGRQAVQDPPATVISSSRGPVLEWRLYRDDSGVIPKGPDDLPPDWFALISRVGATNAAGNLGLRWATRRAAEDEAALAFALLPAERRAELLAGAAHETA